MSEPILMIKFRGWGNYCMQCGTELAELSAGNLAVLLKQTNSNPASTAG